MKYKLAVVVSDGDGQEVFRLTVPELDREQVIPDGAATPGIKSVVKKALQELDKQ